MRKYLLALCVLLVSHAHAQLCQGSLGDPVINFTFGSGSNPGLPLPAATTNYQFFAGDCPQDGFYTVRNSTSNCFSGSWNYITQDHTGNPQGLFMLINASYQPGVFYLDTVKGLCPGTTYEFAAWIANMLRPYACGTAKQYPNITFTIESVTGDTLGRYNTGNLPENSGAAMWIQYGLFFTMPPAQSTVVVRMTNNAPGGCGNDLALDDITFRPCGPSVNASIQGSDSIKVAVCDGQSNVYNFRGLLSAGFNNPAYQWQNSMDSGKTWNDISGSVAITYTKPQTTVPASFLYRMVAAEGANISNNACRVHSNTITVTVNPLPKINIPASHSLCTNDTLTLSVTGGQTYSWQGPNNYTSTDSAIIIPNPGLQYSGNWYTQATSPLGCQVSATTAIAIHTAPVAFAGNDAFICQGNTVQLTGTGAGDGGTYSWYPATGLSAADIYNPIASPADSTLYTLTIKDANNCVVRDTMSVNVWHNPTANAGPDKRIREGEQVQLAGTAGGTSITYRWQPLYNIDNPALLQPTVYPLHDTTYILTVNSQVGCGTAADKVFVRLLEKVRIPNAFSPNGDGINDNWQIEKLYTYPEADVYIYNRYGQPVFHSKGYYKPWDGRMNNQLMPPGTYYYVIDVKNDQPKLTGWVQVVY